MQTKRPLTLLLALLALVRIGLADAGTKSPADGMSAPVVSARTTRIANHVAELQSGSTHVEQDNRVYTVQASCRFLGSPPLPYEVQCFFIARHEGTLERSIYDVEVSPQQGANCNCEFVSKMLAGTTRTSSYSTTLYSNGDMAVTSRKGERKGRKVEGWVVRVVCQGRVLSVEASLPHLAQIAIEMKDQFDEAREKATDTVPAPPRLANAPARPPLVNNPTLIVARTPAPPAAVRVNPLPPAAPPAPVQNNSLPPAAQSSEPIAAIIQIAGPPPAAADPTVLVTEALPKEEENLIAEGPMEGGKFGFSVNPAVRCNIYVIADGYALFAQKGVHVSPATSVSLLPATGTHVRLVAKASKLSALGDDLPDLTAVRANQGSPPFQWIIQASTPDSNVKGGTVSERGDLWLKYGESVRITRAGQTISCRFLGSIARKYCIFECKPAP